MIKVIEKAVEKVAMEWVEKKFDEMFVKETPARYGGYEANNKLKDIINETIRVQITKAVLSHLETEKIDVKQMVSDTLVKFSDKIRIEVKVY